jgi:hypothetical protein
MMTKIVQLNVGGMRYDVAEDTLMKHEDTMLAKMISKKWHKGINEEPLFIDRDGERFRFILDWYRDSRIIEPRTIGIEAIKSDALFFGLPVDAIIEETQSVYDYASSLSENVQRLRRLRLNLAEVKSKNLANCAAIKTEAFAIWVVDQMLEKITLNGISKKVIIRLMDYRKIDGNFWINNSENNKLLFAMQEILATIGEKSHPAFLNSLEINSPSCDNAQVILCFSHYNLP